MFSDPVQDVEKENGEADVKNDNAQSSSPSKIDCRTSLRSLHPFDPHRLRHHILVRFVLASSEPICGRLAFSPAIPSRYTPQVDQDQHCSRVPEIPYIVVGPSPGRRLPAPLDRFRKWPWGGLACVSEFAGSV